MTTGHTSLWHNNVHLYIYMGGLRVVGGSQNYLQHVWAASDCPEGILLSNLARRPHKELGSRESARPKVKGKKDEGHWSVRNRTPLVRVSDSQDSDADGERSRGVRRQHRVRTTRLSSEEWWLEMSQHFWYFGGVSKYTCDSQTYIYTQNDKKLVLIRFAVLKSVFSFFVPPPLFVGDILNYFLFNLRNTHSSGCKKK